MSEYICHRCGYTASQRINLRHHLNRKKICKPILGDISIEEIKKHYNFEINEIPQNTTFLPQNTTYHKIIKTQNALTKYHILKYHKFTTK